MDLTVHADWVLISGIYWLRIAHYQGRVIKVGDRWSWHVYSVNGFSFLAAPAFDHGMAEDLADAKDAVELAIMRHNEI